MSKAWKYINQFLSIYAISFLFKNINNKKQSLILEILNPSKSNFMLWCCISFKFQWMPLLCNHKDVEVKLWNYKYWFWSLNHGGFDKIIEVCCLLYASSGMYIQFTPKLVNYSRHSEPLKYVLRLTISCLWMKMSSILEFFQMFNDSLWRQYLTNFGQKMPKEA